MMPVAAQDCGKLSDLSPLLRERDLRVCLLGAGFDTANLGIGALTIGAIKAFAASFPRAQISLLGYSVERTTYRIRVSNTVVSIPLINMRFSKRLFLSNNIVVLLVMACVANLIPFSAIRRWLIKKSPCLQHLQSSDLVASIAAGDSFSDIYGLQRLLYVSFPQILTILLGKKLVLLPQTIGPFKGKLAKLIARYIIARAERVYSRDYTSVAALPDAGVKQRVGSKVGVCYDLAFVMDPVAPRTVDIIGPDPRNERCTRLVGINISGLLWNGGYTHNNMFGLRSDYKTTVREIVELIITRKKATVMLVPHVLGTARDMESDSVACERVYELLKEKYPGLITLVRGTYEPSEIKYLIGRCDFFVGARMHACIAALSQGIPAVCIAYSRKFTGVMESIDVGQLVADARFLDHAEILETVSRAYDRLEMTRSHLLVKMPIVRDSVLQAVREMVSVALQHPSSARNERY